MKKSSSMITKKSQVIKFRPKRATKDISPWARLALQQQKIIHAKKGT